MLWSRICIPESGNCGLKGSTGKDLCKMLSGKEGKRNSFDLAWITETSEKYKELIYYFLRGGYHVYIPEHCGHGHSYRLVEDPSLVHVDCYKRYVADLLFVARTAKKEHKNLNLYLFGAFYGRRHCSSRSGSGAEIIRKTGSVLADDTSSERESTVA